MLIRKVVTELASKLESSYVLEDAGFRMAETIVTKLGTKAYAKLESDAEFAQRLTDDLRTIAHDRHLVVIPPGGMPDYGELNGPPPNPELNGGITSVKVLDGNIGYMEVRGMVPPEVSAAAIESAFNQLRDCRALILDNRENGGGDPRTVALYVSYLSEGPSFVSSRFHWRKDNRVDEFRTKELGALGYGAKRPLYVLTSRKTFSAGEGFAYEIQALRRGVIVGEITGGGAHSAELEPLAHGFFAMIPNGRAVNPITGSNWEGSGVKPDVEVPAERALEEAVKLAAGGPQ